MTVIRRLWQVRWSQGDRHDYSVFLCPWCNGESVKRTYSGKKLEHCSRACTAEKLHDDVVKGRRKKRKIISSYSPPCVVERFYRGMM